MPFAIGMKKVMGILYQVMVKDDDRKRRVKHAVTEKMPD